MASGEVLDEGAFKWHYEQAPIKAKAGIYCSHTLLAPCTLSISVSLGCVGGVVATGLATCKGRTTEVKWGVRSITNLTMELRYDPFSLAQLARAKACSFLARSQQPLQINVML